MTHLLGNILVLYLVVLKIIYGSLLLFFMLPRLQVQTFGLMFFPPNNSAFNHYYASYCYYNGNVQ